ncbi:MAG: hypothetical protein NT029_12155 [Armatimonadetes bacterium]|nr:hypothetical protein [Armatimonadota bacterium]
MTGFGIPTPGEKGKQPPAGLRSGNRTMRALVAALLATVAAVAFTTLITYRSTRQTEVAVEARAWSPNGNPNSPIAPTESVSIVTEEPSPGIIWIPLALACGLGVVYAIRRGRSASRMRFLGEVTDVTVAGRLAEALWEGDLYMRTEAEEALIGLLPRFKASDAGCLSDAQRACLHRTLKAPKRRREADLIVAVIGALTEIGDARALPHVERLAEETARTEAQRLVQRAAMEALPALHERIEVARAARTLVRPAQGGPGADTLVRPAAPSADTPVELLVRASAAPPER